MDGVLATSRIPISLLPVQHVAEVARERGIDLDDFVPPRRGERVVVRPEAAVAEVLAEALVRWWEHIPIWKRLDFAMQHQQQTQWCWAATSVSVAKYYRSWSTWTQCAMVNAEKGQSTCCTNGSSDACNQPHVLNAPLSRAEVLDHMVSATVTYAELQTEIAAGRPVAWRIGWSGGGGHFAVIEGYRVLGGQWVAIDDPWYGESDVALTTLTGGTYQGTGTWTHTYFTKRQPFPWVFENEQVFEFPWVIWQEISKPRDKAQPVGAAGGEQG